LLAKEPSRTNTTENAGPIPAASTFRLNQADSGVSFGRNDSLLLLLFEPTRVPVHGSLELGLVAVAVDSERRVQVTPSPK